MKIENLKVGMVLKNYKELCRVLEIQPKTGRGRQNQIAWIEEHVDFERSGHRYIIKMLKKRYVEPQSDGRGGANNVGENLFFTELEVDREHWYSRGVYSVTQDNNVYIGSTVEGFRARFMRHASPAADNPRVSQMLRNGGVFRIVCVMNTSTTEEIRNLEKSYIEDYNSNSKWDLVNVTHSHNRFRHLSVDVHEDDYEELNNIINNFLEGKKSQ